MNNLAQLSNMSEAGSARAGECASSDHPGWLQGKHEQRGKLQKCSHCESTWHIQADLDLPSVGVQYTPCTVITLTDVATFPMQPGRLMCKEYLHVG